MQGSVMSMMKQVGLRAAPPRRVLPLIVAASIAVVLDGCRNPFGGGDCLAIGVAGLQVSVVDAATTRAPASAPSVRIVDGTYSEVLMQAAQGTAAANFFGAVERAGTYRVLVTASGYQDSARDNVQVNRDGSRCNALQPTHITVPLARTM